MKPASLLRFGLIGLAVACAPAQAPVATAPSAPPSAPAQPATAPVQSTFPTTAPALGPVPALRLPAGERRALSNGLQVVYVRHGSLPVVHATLLLPAGSAVDPANM